MNNNISFQPLRYGTVLILIFFGICLPVTFSGVVVDIENANKPIPGVWVSAGHTLFRTITDEQGRFSIDAPQTNIHSINIQLSKSTISIPWDRRKRFIDLSNASASTSISLYSLKGSRLFHRDILTKNRFVRIPSVAQGIFILKIDFNNHSSYSWKWSALSPRGIFSVPIVGPGLGKSAYDGGETLLLFRHDDYFPFERKLGSPAQDLIISMRPDPCRFIFDRTKIHSYFFTVTHADSLFLEQHAFEEQYVSADFSFDSVPFGKVGLRFKGSKYYLLKDCFDSLGRVTTNPLCAKVAMKVKFDKYDDTARFYSLKRLNMHAMSDDPSKMHEMLCYKLFRDMGIYAPRTAYMKLFVNGSFQGLFLAVEEIDGRFTKSRWPYYGDGNLFKEKWPNWANHFYFEEGLITNNQPQDSGNGKRMSDFSRAILSSTKETFVKNVSPYMDLDYWVRYIAVDRAIHNADGVMTWYYDRKSGWLGNHNYYFYQEENPGGKIWLIPWDLPATLTKTDPIVDDKNMPDWYVEPDTCAPKPIWGTDYGFPPHCDPLTALTADVLWDNFAKAGEQFLAGCFKSDTMKQKIDTYKTLIEPVVAQDSAIKFKTWENEVRDLRLTMDILNTTFTDYIRKKAVAFDTAEFFTPFPDAGFLSTERVNNFEFSAIVPMTPWSQSFSSLGTTVSLSVDTISPLWGKSDVLSRFVFVPLDSSKTYAEWIQNFLYFKEEKNLKDLKQIRMNLKSDASRTIFVFLSSKAYDRLGSENAYGWWSVPINTTSKQYTFEMSRISYPTWGDPGNPDILDTVVSTASGIGFSPQPRFNNIGKLSVIPDSGFLRIDNIFFEF
jgi:spore coat protein H